MAEILTTQLDVYEVLRWERKPLLDYHPRIQTFLKGRLGDEYADILAEPRLSGAGVRAVVSWRANMSRGAQNLLQLRRENAEEALRQAEAQIETINALIDKLGAAETDNEQEWADLLKACFSNVGEQHIFVENGKIAVAAWGIRSLKPIDRTPFYRGRPREMPRAQRPVVPPLPEETSPSNPSEEGIAANEEKTSAPPPAAPPASLKEDLSRDASAPGGTRPVAPVSEESAASKPNTPASGPSVPPPPPPLRDEAVAEPIADDAPDEKGKHTGPPPPPTAGGGGKYRRRFPSWQWLLLLLLLLLLSFLAWKSCFPPRHYLPEQPGQHVPIGPGDVEMDKDSARYIAKDRINVALVGENKDLKAFSRAFKAAYKDEKYSIIYYDTAVARVQLKVPEEELDQIMQELEGKIRATPNGKDFEFLVWPESIMQSNAKPSEADFRDVQKSWYFEPIRVAGAWDKSYGDADVIVAIIDDGFDVGHEELSGKVKVAWNILNQNDNVFTYRASTHGTHVAGTAAAKRDNGAGVAGIAPDCQVMPIQVSNSQGVLSSTAIIDAVLYAVKHDADVVNLSLGMSFGPLVKMMPPHAQKNFMRSMFKAEEAVWNQVLDYAEKRGTAVVMAAGNENLLVGLDPMQRSDKAIKVSALDQQLGKAAFSNYGELSTVSAPGVGIYSSIPGNGYTYMDGTSMAAPIVTGAVALLKSINPDLTPAQIRKLLVSTGKAVGPSVGPLIQLDRAVENIEDVDEIELPDMGPDCDSVRQRIDELQAELDQLLAKCPDAGQRDTMKIPEKIDDLGFAVGRWKSTTSLYNEEEEEVVLYFDILPDQTGVFTLREPDGTACKAPLSLKAGARSFDMEQLAEARCGSNQGGYSAYAFTCAADANGYAECKAQNKSNPLNRVTFKLIKIR